MIVTVTYFQASTEIGMKASELLKLFNSRTCQLVLGAGAVSVAGLKTITIRNLCCSSLQAHQGLSLFPLESRLHVGLVARHHHRHVGAAQLHHLALRCTSLRSRRRLNVMSAQICLRNDGWLNFRPGLNVVSVSAKMFWNFE